MMLDELAAFHPDPIRFVLRGEVERKVWRASHYHRSWRKHHGARRNPMACESRSCWILR